MGEIIGYCRVSTDGQTLNDQIAALKAAGASKIFAETERRTIGSTAVTQGAF